MDEANSWDNAYSKERAASLFQPGTNIAKVAIYDAIRTICEEEDTSVDFAAVIFFGAAAELCKKAAFRCSERGEDKREIDAWKAAEEYLGLAADCLTMA